MRNTGILRCAQDDDFKMGQDVDRRDGAGWRPRYRVSMETSRRGQGGDLEMRHDVDLRDVVRVVTLTTGDGSKKVFQRSG